MTRAFARPQAVLALVAILAVAGIPGAVAKPLSSPVEQSAETGWLVTAWSWLSSVLGFDANQAEPRATEPEGMARAIGHTASCIDPMGNPYPCGQYLNRPPAPVLTGISGPRI